MAIRFLLLALLGLTVADRGFSAEPTPAPNGKVTGYYAETEFNTPTLGDDYWAKFRAGMEVSCPQAFQKPFVWQGPKTGFGVVKATFYRASNVVVSTKRFLVTRGHGPCEMEPIKRVEYLRKEKGADGIDIIESTTSDPTGKTLRHRFQPGASAKLDFLISDNKAGAGALAQQAAGFTEVGKTTYLGFPAVQLESARLRKERTELADDPAVPAELRHAVMEETQHGPQGEITMATRTLVLRPTEMFDASLLSAPAVTEEAPKRR